ncbi:hypothetical protein KBB96_06220 [Luteolibacter ambystomatis]|uniref:PA14 domain-containing protein n=1 Tax=Luteolibacter ambystomatis TaxID=2824561 RepID=A0A975J1U5_9BACT|nr:hypothetical protein [Luteolibacter ambystomatis]QUE52485.1 hypothetical protein KBB96_06220 [Luteolibacter ambystomatis]
MQPANHSPDLPATPTRENKPSFWKKLGGGSLSISLIVHAILLSIGLVWIFQVIPDKVPDPDFMPKGGGGGSPGVKEISNKKQRATMSTPNTPRMAAKGASSSFTLPEPDAASAMSSVGSLSSGGLSGGLGGSGSGGGRGDGQGKGFGSGMGPGLGGGAGKMSPFGMIDPNANAFTGVLYDTKQTTKRESNQLTEPEFLKVINDFVKRGWNEREFAKFYQAPQKLYQTRIYIPNMSAGEAPKAFRCENEVQPSRWIVLYRGVVTPPKSGRYRFVGAADDLITVRFDGKSVLDAGYYSANLGRPVWGETAKVLAGKVENKELEKELRRAFKLPVAFYEYPTATGYTSMMGGCMLGTEFEARQGSSYPLEILISEIPGGVFGASLFIEEIGATYGKAPTGAPILPLFRLDGDLPPVPVDTAASPPFDPSGPVWKLVSGQIKPGI